MNTKIIFGLILTLALVNFISCDDDFSSASYNSLSRQQKFEKIWNRVNENKTPYGWYSAISLARIFFEAMAPSFDSVSDNFTSSRNKYIHAVGVVGHVEFVAEQDPDVNPYSGIFKGCSHVILRMSCAKEPEEKKVKAEDAADNFTPGFGIKFLRDGVHSGNTVAMYGVNGQNSWNFFKNDFSNHIAPAEGVALKALEAKFATLTPFTGKVGLMDMSMFDQDGKSYSSNYNFPYKLIFRPDSTLASRFTDFFKANFMTQLESIEEGTTIYEVLALATPMSNPVAIGKLVLRGKFTKSK